MMKRFILIAAMLSCATVLVADSLDSVIAKISSASLTSVKSQGTTDRITGWLERIDLKFGNATSSVAVAVFSSNSVSGLTTTFLSVPAISNAASYTPRKNAQDTLGNIGTNDTHRFMMLDETVYVTATNASYAGQTVQAVIMYERP